MKNERLFKVLNTDGTPAHGGDGKWSLPTLIGPGDWMPPITNIQLCQRGYHLCREQDLIEWLGPMICLADYRGERLDGGNKIVVSEARLLEVVPTWGEKSMRLFAADCAEHVLRYYEAKYPKDNRPRKAIIAAREYAMNPIPDVAALARARAAAEEAARAAEEAARAGAAEEAARAGAWAVERKWQTKRLMGYLFAV